jgi:hypothetical protein
MAIEQYNWDNVKILIRDKEIEGVTSIQFRDNTLELRNEFIEKYKELEERVVKQVLRLLLNREPTIDDAKKCHRIFKLGIIDKYILAYEGTALGQIIHTGLSVKFIPETEFK